MSEQRLFYIAQEQLTAYWSAGKRLHEDRCFPATAEGYAQFGDYVAQYPDFISRVLVDIVEEEYRNDTIPHVMGKDSLTIQQRKLAQLYHRTPYRGTVIQGRMKPDRATKARRDDKVLLAAITNPEKISPWMAVLADKKIPVSGIHSLSSLGQVLLKKLKIQQQNVLLISAQQGNTIRQTFLQDRMLKISRSSVVAAAVQDDYALFIQQEAQKNKRYLHRLQLLPHTASLDVYVICNADEVQSLTAQCPDSDALHFHFVPVDEAAARIGLKAQLHASQCEQLYIHLLADHAPKLNYAAAEERRYYFMRQARKALVAASVVLVLASAVWGGMTVMEGLALRDQIAGIQQQTRNVREGYKYLAAKLPKTDIQPLEMQYVVHIARLLQQYKTNPQLMMVSLSDGLKKFTNLEVDEIEWQSSSTPVIDGESNDNGEYAAAGAEEQDAPAPEVTQKQSYQIASIKGKLNPFDGNYQRAFRAVDNFVSALRSDKSFVHVEAVHYPLDIASDSTLLVNSGKEARGSQAQFEIRAVLQVGDGKV